jgi:hypothetical protein
MTTFVCAALFAILVLATFIIGGLSKSASQLKGVGYNGQYLTAVSSTAGNSGNSELRSQATRQLDAELHARKIVVTDDVHNNDQYIRELSNRVILLTKQKDDSAFQQFEAAIRKNDQPSAIYHFDQITSMANAHWMPEGRDAFVDAQAQTILDNVQPNDVKFLDKGAPSIMQVESGMLKPLLQPGMSFDWKQGDPYPLVVPYSFLPTLAGHSVDATSPSEAQISQYKQLIKQYTGATVAYCYRNDAAQNQVDATLRYNVAAKNDKDPKTNPIAIDACQPLDQAALKKAGIIGSGAQGADIKPLFPSPVQQPQTQVVQFKIVGFAPTQYSQTDAKGNPSNGNLINQFFSGVNNWGPISNIGIVPREVAAQVPLFQQDPLAGLQGGITPRQLFVDFQARTAQKDFVAQSCSVNGNVNCTTTNPWSIDTFGNIGVAVEKMVQTVSKILLWAGILLGGIASVIVMVTVSKIIADSRREIAVFLALGARRRDVIALYMGYGLILAGGAICMALGIATVGALLLSSMYNSSLSSSIIVSTGAYDAVLHASLFGVRLTWLAAVLGVLLGAYLIGMTLPLASNVRRNLVQFMRDE